MDVISQFQIEYASTYLRNEKLTSLTVLKTT